MFNFSKCFTSHRKLGLGGPPPPAKPPHLASCPRCCARGDRADLLTLAQRHAAWQCREGDRCFWQKDYAAGDRLRDEDMWVGAIDGITIAVHELEIAVDRHVPLLSVNQSPWRTCLTRPTDPVWVHTEGTAVLFEAAERLAKLATVFRTQGVSRREFTDG